MTVRVLALSVVAAMLLVSCAQLPASGPSASEIAAEKASPTRVDYRVIDVTRETVEHLAGRSDETFAGSFPDKGGGGSEVIGVGDIVAVTIWEAAVGGLFSAGATQTNGSKSATIPEQPVSAAGTITVPYAGEVQVAGRTPAEVRRIVEASLAGKAIEPQVLVTVTKNNANTVTVTGEVVRGGLVPLPSSGARVLDALASVGGTGAPTHEVFLQLSRGGRTARVPLQTVVDDPSENVRLRSRDTLVVLRLPQTFTTFGATGTSARVPFEAKGMTLDEAVARVGGLRDFQADPSGVFVFRFEQPSVVRLLDAQHPDLVAGRDSIPIVYRVNLRDPAGFFMAKAFRVYDNDLIYVATAPANEFQKFMALLSAATQPVQSGASVYRQIQN